MSDILLDILHGMAIILVGFVIALLCFGLGMLLAQVYRAICHRLGQIEDREWRDPHGL